MATLSLEDPEGLRCVDFVTDGPESFGFKEFRRDPEDGGRWTLVADYTRTRYTSREDAMRAAAGAIGWFEPPDAGPSGLKERR